MRLAFLICVITGCVGGLSLGILDIVLNKGKNLLGVSAIITAINAFAFYGKQAQAKSESIKSSPSIKKEGE